MKKIGLALCLLGLASCASLDSQGKCYYGAVPQQYFTAKNGEAILNPEYVQYEKCYGTPTAQPIAGSSGTVMSLLKDAYVVNGQRYTLYNGQRQFKPGGGYVKSMFTTAQNETAVTQEIFSYYDAEPFQQRFFKDINAKEGSFKAESVDGVAYYIGKNNRQAYIIYIVKNVLSNEIAIVQFMSKAPLLPKEVPQLVRDLNKI